MGDATKDLLEPYLKLPSSSDKLGRYERAFFKYYMEMHSSDKITDAFVQRCIREGVDYRIWKRNFKPEGVADFEGYLKERARNERKYVKRLTLKKDQKKRLSAFLNDSSKEYESADRDGEDIEIEMEGDNARVVEQRDEGDDAMETEK